MRIFAGSWAQTSYQILPHYLCGNIFTIIKMCLVTLFFYLPRLIRQLIKDETVVIFNILFYLIFFVTSLESVNLKTKRENITTMN